MISFRYEATLSSRVVLTVRRNRLILISKVPRCFLSLDQPIDGTVQRSGRPHPLRFARKRAAQELCFSWELVTDVVQHRRRMVGPRAYFVPLPWLCMAFASHGRCHFLAFCD